MSIKVFYHMVSPTTPCPDGIAAAWVCRKLFEGFKDVQFVGCEYQKTVPEVKRGDIVYVVDFSFPAEVLEEWKAIAEEVFVIDHHENKMKELLGIASLQDIITFDNSKCGALLAWETFFEAPPPPFLLYINDRDLWNHELPFTHEIHAATGKLGRTFEVFDVLAELSSDQLITFLGKLGTDALEERRKAVEQIAKRHRIWEAVAGHKDIPVVELQESDGWATSDVCSVLYKQYPEAPFVACVTYKAGGMVWSLRSDKDGNNTDVAAIAQQFGGGGHRNAAGYKITIGGYWESEV